MSFIGEKYYHVTDHDRRIIELEVISEESIGCDNYGTKVEPKMVEWFEVGLQINTDITGDRSVELEMQSKMKKYFSYDLDDRNGLFRTFEDAKTYMVHNITRSIGYNKDELQRLEELLETATNL